MTGSPTPTEVRARLKTLLCDLMLIPGLSGYEGRVRKYLAAEMQKLGIATRTDRLGNLTATLEGEAGAPAVHEDIADNVAGRVTLARGDVEAALRAAPRVAKLELRIGRGGGQPMETRCISPPESRSVLRSSRWPMRRVLAAYSMRFSISAGLVLRTLALSGKARFSRTVRRG